MDWRLLLLVAIASGIGGGARYLMHGLATYQHYPTGTLAVNALGCFLIGLLVFGGSVGGWMSAETRIVIGLGLLGGFTTMSTFTFQTVSLVETGEHLLAGLNILATLVICLGATWAGRAIGLLVWSGGG